MKRSKRALSLLLALSILLGLVPAMSPRAEAATNIAGTFEGQDADIFTALGFDTSEIPEGYEADTTENPTGKEKSLGNQVHELVLSNISGSRVDGHNNNDVAAGNLGNISSTTGPGFRMSAAVAGDFDGDGLPGEVAYVGFQSMSYSANRLPLYLAIYDTNGDALGTGTKKMLSLESNLHPGDGLTNKDYFETLAKYDWAWQNLLQITSGDYDGDGTAEIAIYVPERDNARVEVYKYQRTSQSGEMDWATIGNWSRVWSHALSTTGEAVPNMVSLASGDFDQDGVDDLAIASGSAVIVDTNMSSATKEMLVDTLKASTARVLWGNKTKMLQGSTVLDLNEEDLGEQVRVSLTAGDLDGDGHRELIATGQALSELRNYRGSNVGALRLAEGNKTRTITTYLYDSAMGLVINASDTYAPVEGDFVTTETEVLGEDGEMTTVTSTNWSGNGFDSHYHSAPLMNTNAAAFKPEGQDYTYLYLDSCLYEYNQGALILKVSLDEADNYDMDGARLGGTGYWGSDNQSATGGFYVEYGAASGDLWGWGNQVLAIGTYASGSRERSQATYTSHKYGYGLLYGNANGRLYTKVDLTEANKEKGIRAYSAAFADTDIDTVIMEYTGVHYLTYSDPKVLAVIAAAPYFEDVDIVSDYDYAWQNTTSYSTTTGEGKGEHTSVDLEFGLYAYSEVTSSGGMINQELSANFTLEWTKETTDITEYTLSFETSQDEDAVAFFSIPIENYVYRIHTPDGSGGYQVEEQIVSRTFTPCYQILNLDYYESIRGNYDNLPAIRGEVIESTPGDPASYPFSTAFYDVIEEWEDDPAGVSFGNGSITQEISVTQEKTASFNMGAALDFKYGGGLNLQSDIGQAQAQAGGGFQFSMNPSGGWTDINLTGTTFTGTVTNMPLEFQDYGYYYSWKLFAYHYEIGEDNKIPVVSYVVDDVSEPPKLPKDFQQDFDRSTSESNLLTWTYDGTFSSFHIYKYFDFPVGGGLQLVETIPASTPNYTVKYDENGKPYKEYFYEDSNLAAYTEYEYAIQVERLSAIPPLSSPSGLMTARTKAAEGYPLSPITESDNKNDGFLQIYPDKTSYLTVNVTGPEGEKRDNYYSVVQYQWQKLEKTGWTDLVNETGMTLTFAEAGVETTGEYRCRVNVLTKADNTGITAYTDPVELVHAKRSSFFESLYTRDLAGGIELYAKVANGHTDSGAIPAGTVTFTLTNNATGKTYQNYVKLNAEGVAQKIVLQTLPAGMYTLDAYYSGSYIFTACEQEALYLSQRLSGFDVDAPSTVIYGNTAQVSFRMATKADGLTETEDVAADQYGFFPAALCASGKTGATLAAGDTVTKGTSYHFSAEYGDVTFKAPVDGVFFGVENSYALIDQDGIFENSTGLADALSLGYFTGQYQLAGTLPTGTYVVRMQRDGETAHSFLTIAPRPIQLQLPTQSVGEGTASSALRSTRGSLEVLSGSWAPHDLQNENFLNQAVSVLYYNTAGKVSYANTVTNTCGAYTIRGTSSIDNYDVRYQEGFLAVLGATHQFKLGVRPFNSQQVGTAYILSPDFASTREAYDASPADQQQQTGTRLVLQAVPDEGYEVYDWYINGEAQGSTATSLAHVMLNEDTRVEVQFTVKQHSLSFGAAGDQNGGSITCNDPEFKSGGVVLGNTLFTFTAQAQEGYHFKEWRYNEIGKGTVYDHEDEGAMSSTFHLQMPQASCSVYAVFERDYYRFSYEDLNGIDGLTAWYMGYSTSDTTGKPEKITIESGDKLKGDSLITLEPKPGYYFDTQFNWVSQGSQGTANTGSYTLTLQEDTRVTGYTRRDAFPVELNVAVKAPDYGADTYQGENASWNIPFQQPLGATLSYTYENVSGSQAYNAGELVSYSNTYTYRNTLEAVPGNANLSLRMDLPAYYSIVGWASNATQVWAGTEENRQATYVQNGGQVEAGKPYFFTLSSGERYYFIAPATGRHEIKSAPNTDEDSTQIFKWGSIVYVPGNTYVLNQLSEADSVTVKVQEKNVYQVKLARIEDHGQYLYNASAGEFALPPGAALLQNYETVNGVPVRDTVRLHEGDSLTLMVTPDSDKTVTYWRCTPLASGGQAVQSRASSLKYIIPNIQEDYLFEPIFSASTYYNITWPNISESYNQVRLVPDEGFISNVARDGMFAFYLEGEGLSQVEAVLANGVPFTEEGITLEDGTFYYCRTPNNKTRYCIQNISDHQEISLQMKKVGVSVNGVDVGQGTGLGWSYDAVEQELTITGPGLTLSGSNTGAPGFRVLVQEGVTELIFEDLHLSQGAEYEPAVFLNTLETMLTLRGKNSITTEETESYTYPETLLEAKGNLFLAGDGRLDLERISTHRERLLYVRDDLQIIQSVQLYVRDIHPDPYNLDEFDNYAKHGGRDSIRVGGDMSIGRAGNSTDQPKVRIECEDESVTALETNDLNIYAGDFQVSTLSHDNSIRAERVLNYGGIMRLRSANSRHENATGSVMGEPGYDWDGQGTDWLAHYPEGYVLLAETSEYAGEANPILDPEPGELVYVEKLPEDYSNQGKDETDPGDNVDELYLPGKHQRYKSVIIAPYGTDVGYVKEDTSPAVFTLSLESEEGDSYSLTFEETELLNKLWDEDLEKYTNDVEFHLVPQSLEEGAALELKMLDEEEIKELEWQGYGDLHFTNAIALVEPNSSLSLHLGNSATNADRKFHYTLSGRLKELPVMGIQEEEILSLTLDKVSLPGLITDGESYDLYLKGENQIRGDFSPGSSSEGVNIISPDGTGSLQVSYGQDCLQTERLNLHNVRSLLLTNRSDVSALHPGVEGSYELELNYVDSLGSGEALPYGKGWKMELGSSAADAFVCEDLSDFYSGKVYRYVKITPESAAAQAEPATLIYNETDLMQSQLSTTVTIPIDAGKAYHRIDDTLPTAQRTSLKWVTGNSEYYLLDLTSGVGAQCASLDQDNLTLRLDLSQYITLPDYADVENDYCRGMLLSQFLADYDRGEFRLEFYDPDPTDESRHVISLPVQRLSAAELLEITSETGKLELLRGSTLQLSAQYVGKEPDTYEWTLVNPAEGLILQAKGNTATLQVAAGLAVEAVDIQVTTRDETGRIIGQKTSTIAVLPVAQSLEIGCVGQVPSGDGSFILRQRSPDGSARTWSFQAKATMDDATVKDVALTWTLWGAQRAATGVDAQGILTVDPKETGTNGLLKLTASYENPDGSLLHQTAYLHLSTDAHVSYDAAEAEGGVVTSSLDPAGQWVQAGSVLSFTGEAKPGYLLDAWYVNEVLVTEGVSGNTLSFTASANSYYTVRASFVPDIRHTLSFSAEAGGSLSATLGGQSLSSGDSLQNSADVTFTAAAEAYYQVAGWTVNGEAYLSEDGTPFQGDTLTLRDIQADTQVQVSFQRKPVALTFKALSGEEGKLPAGTLSLLVNGEATEVEGKPLGNALSYTYTAQATDSVTILASPDVGYMVSGWSLGEQPLEGSDGRTSYHIPSLTQDRELSVTFQPLTDCTVTIYTNSDENGAGTVRVLGEEVPMSSAKTLSVTKHSDLSLTAVPDAGSSLYRWEVEGAAYSAQGNVLTLSNITEAVTVKAIFQRSSQAVTLATAENGSLSGSYCLTLGETVLEGSLYAGSSQVPSGSTVLLQAKPMEGYAFAGMQVNGAAVQAAWSEAHSAYCYEVPGLTQALSASASFEVSQQTRFDVIAPTIYDSTWGQPEEPEPEGGLGPPLQIQGRLSLHPVPDGISGDSVNGDGKVEIAPGGSAILCLEAENGFFVDLELLTAELQAVLDEAQSQVSFTAAATEKGYDITLRGIDKALDFTGMDNPFKRITEESARYTVCFAQSENGSLAVTWNGIALQSGAKVPAQAELIVTAAADEHYQLVSLLNGQEELVGDSLTVTADVNLTASFAISEYPLTVRSAGEGSVLVNGEAWPNGKTGYLPAGSDVILAYTYDDTLLLLDTNYQPGVYLMDQARVISAEFRSAKATVVYEQSANGSLAVYHGSYLVASGDSLPVGTTLTLVTTPAEHYRLSSLTADGTPILKDNYMVRAGQENRLAASFCLAEASVSWTDAKGSLTVTTMPEGAAVANGQYLPVGTKLRLSPKANPGETLTGLSVTGAELDEATGWYSLQADTLITVQYENAEVPPTADSFVVDYAVTGQGSLSILAEGKPVQKGDKVPAGTVLTITATPAEHYRLSSLSNGGVELTQGQLTVDRYVSLLARFEASEYPVDLLLSGDGAVELNGKRYTESTSLYVPTGSKLTVAYDYNKIQQSLSASHAAGTYTVDRALRIQADFTPITAAVVFGNPMNGSLRVYAGDKQIVSGDRVPMGTVLTIEATPDAHYKLISLSNGGSPIEPGELTVTGDLSLLARFEVSEYLVDIQLSGKGKVKLGDTEYAESTSLYLPAGSELALSYVYDAATQSLNASHEAGTYKVDRALRIQADFITKTASVSFNHPANGSLRVLAGEQKLANGDRVPVGTVLTVSAIPDVHYKLEGLSNRGEAIQPGALTVTEAVELNAQFAASEYALKLQLSGPGKVLVNGEAYSESTTLYLPVGSDLTIGYDYDSQRAELSTTHLAGDYSLNAPMSLEAKFTTSFASVYFSQSPNGTLRVYEGDRPLGSGDTVAVGTILRVEAQPEAHYRLAKLLGGGAAISDGTYQVKAGVNNLISASFERAEVALTWTDTYGSISAKLMPEGTPVASGQYIPIGSQLQISAQPQENYLLTALTVKGGEQDPATGYYSLREDAEVIASYQEKAEEPPVITYMVQKELLGHGSLRILANGLEVEDGQQLESGTVLTIEATPDDGAELVSLEVNGVSFENGGSYQVFANTKVRVVFDDSGEVGGLPYYLEGDKKIFIGFSYDLDGNGIIDKDEYLAPEGKKIRFMENPKNFTDISKHWGEASIDFVTEREIFNGVTTTTFGPERPLDRGMFVTIIGRLYERSYGEIPEAQGFFTDCTYEDYYGKYVDWAYANGIINGYGDGTFGPKNLITREQMAVILYNFAVFLDKVPENMDTALAYPDADKISAWAVDGARFCQFTGLIQGSSNGNFAPKNNTKRVEMAVVTMRLIEFMLK